MHGYHISERSMHKLLEFQTSSTYILTSFVIDNYVHGDKVDSSGVLVQNKILASTRCSFSMVGNASLKSHLDVEMASKAGLSTMVGNWRGQLPCRVWVLHDGLMPRRRIRPAESSN